MSRNPLKNIEVIPLAAESFGVRSMCTYVETGDVRVLLDPGVSLGQRFALLPHPREYNAINVCRKRLAQFADRAEVVTISHYHFDHSTPTYTDYAWNWSSLEVAREIYQDKIVLAKGIRGNINHSQRRRGWMLRKIAGSFMRKIETADGNTFKFGETSLKFSHPVFHGEQDTMLGWVLMLTIECQDERLTYAPDVQGPILDETLETILSEKPNLVLIGGPPLYLSGFKIDEKKVRHGLENLARIVEKVPVTILEHHLLRDENWRNYSSPAFEVAKKVNHAIYTAAEFVGEVNTLLEFQRRNLYQNEPPSQSFIKWTKLPRARQRETQPPI